MLSGNKRKIFTSCRACVLFLFFIFVVCFATIYIYAFGMNTDFFVLEENGIASNYEQIPNNQIALNYNQNPNTNQIAPNYNQNPNNNQIAPNYNQNPNTNQIAPNYNQNPNNNQIAPNYNQIPNTNQIAPNYNQNPKTNQIAPNYNQNPSLIPQNNKIPLTKNPPKPLGLEPKVPFLDKDHLLTHLIDVYAKEKEILGLKESFYEWLTERKIKPIPSKSDSSKQTYPRNSSLSKSEIKNESTPATKAKVEPSRGLSDSTFKQPTNNHPEPSGNLPKDKGSAPPLVILFTSMIDIPDKRLVMENVLRTWTLWQPIIKPVVFANDDKIKKQAAQFGWETMSYTKTACSGVPIHREMFRAVMKAYPHTSLFGFVNGDMLLGNGILPTMETVAKWASTRNKPLMLLLRRINVDFYNKPSIANVDNLDQIAMEGKPMTDGSTDGIFTNRRFPWEHVPDVVPGRTGGAMWMASYGREMGADVIDISDTVTAVHMTSTKAGNKEAWLHKDSRCNHHIYDRLKIKPQSWFCGFIRCATFKTMATYQGREMWIKVIDKSASNHKRCGECHMNLTPLTKTIF